MDTKSHDELVALCREQVAIIDTLTRGKLAAEANAFNLSMQLTDLANLHVVKAVAGAVVPVCAGTDAPLETSEGEARPLTAAQLTVALDAQGKLSETYRDLAMQADPEWPAGEREPWLMGRAAGIEEAAKYLDKIAYQYIQEHARTDPNTGAIVWEFGDDGRDYYSILIEEADAIRALNNPGG